MRRRIVERGHQRLEPLERRRIGFIRRHRLRHIDRRDQDHLVFDRVEDDHRGWPHQDGIRHAECVWIDVGQVLDEAHAIVAHVADHPRRVRRQSLGQVDGTFCQQGAQAIERRLRLRLEGLGLGLGCPVDLGDAAVRTPDDVGVEPYERVAPAHRPPSTDSSKDVMRRPSASFR